MITKDQSVSFGILIVYSLVAGSAFLFTSYASNDIPPFTLCALRLLIGSIGLSLLSTVFYRHVLPDYLGDIHFIKISLIMGIFNNFLPYSLYPYAYYFGVDVGISSIFSGLTPLLALIFSAFMLPNGIHIVKNIRNITGMIIGVLGIVIVSIGNISNPEFSGIVFVGYFMLLLYACSKAFASVYGSKNIINYHIIPMAAGQTICGCICATLCSVNIDYWFPPSGYAAHYDFFLSTSWKTWGGVLYLGLGPSLLCYLFQFYLLKKAGALKQIVVDFLTPIVGIVEGALFAGDWDDVTGLFISSEIIGSLFLAGGIICIHSVNKTTQNPQDDSKEKLNSQNDEYYIYETNTPFQSKIN